MELSKDKVQDFVINQEPKDRATKAATVLNHGEEGVNLNCRTTQRGSDDQVLHKLSSEPGYSDQNLLKHEPPIIMVKRENDVDTFSCSGDPHREDYSHINNWDSCLIVIKPETDGSDETGVPHSEKCQVESEVTNDTKPLDQYQEISEICATQNDNQILHSSPLATSRDKPNTASNSTVSDHKETRTSVRHESGEQTRSEEHFHVCDICDKKYKQLQSLRRHMRMHTGELPFVCPTCNKRYTSSSALSTHLRTHTGERPFICPTCGKGFTQAGNLTIHIRFHTGERPFVCPICGRGFIQSSELNDHVKSHSGGARRFVCPTCSKGFISKGDLSNHIKIHTGERPFVCPTCSKGFIKSSSLVLHMRTHTGQWPFVCTTCSKGFNSSTDYSNHLRTHTGERPFVCPTCDKGFKQSSHLKKHLKRHVVCPT